MLRLRFSDIAVVLFANVLVISLMVQSSQSIAVSFGTRQGPIEVPVKTTRRAIHPIPHRAIPAAVWEFIPDDIPQEKPYVYMLPDPLVKPGYNRANTYNYHADHGAQEFGIRYQNKKNSIAVQRSQHQFQQKVSKKFAKYLPHKIQELYPTLPKKQRRVMGNGNGRIQRSYI